MLRVTQQQRGRVLAFFFVVVTVTFQTLNWWANSHANDRAAAVEAQLRRDLPTVNLLLLRTRGTDRSLNKLPVRSVIQEGEGVRVNVEVSALWQVRCVVAHIGPDLVATTKNYNKGCGG